MADETRPQLCAHHRAVLASLAAKDHVDDRDSDRVAVEMSRQCCSSRWAS